MRKRLTRRWLFFFVLHIPIVGCSIAEDLDDVPSVASEDEFWRTTYCVSGGLPMEIQFPLDGNPVRLKGDKLDLKDVDRIGKQLDIRIASLLRDSITIIWQQTYGNQPNKWTSDLTKELAEGLVIEISERAPGYLGIKFCGSDEQVGNAAFASIFDYFSRAVRLEDGRSPSWLTQAEASSNGGIIAMIATSLRLAQIEFEVDKLIRTLSE